jgi:hypothetical protein
MRGHGVDGSIFSFPFLVYEDKRKNGNVMGGTREECVRARSVWPGVGWNFVRFFATADVGKPVACGGMNLMAGEYVPALSK